MCGNEYLVAQIVETLYSKREPRAHSRCPELTHLAFPFDKALYKKISGRNKIKEINLL